MIHKFIIELDIEPDIEPDEEFDIGVLTDRLESALDHGTVREALAAALYGKISLKLITTGWYVLLDDEDAAGGCSVHGPFNKTEAEAFMDGVEHVNDSAIKNIRLVQAEDVPADAR